MISEYIIISSSPKKWFWEKIVGNRVLFGSLSLRVQSVKDGVVRWIVFFMSKKISWQKGSCLRWWRNPTEFNRNIFFSLEFKKIKSDQIWSNLIKSDQIWWKQHFDQIWSDLIRFDQIWSDFLFLVLVQIWIEKIIKKPFGKVCECLSTVWIWQLFRLKSCVFFFCVAISADLLGCRPKKS